MVGSSPAPDWRTSRIKMIPSPRRIGTVHTNFGQAVAQNLMANWESFPIFARNQVVGNSTEDVWGPGGLLVYPTVAGPLTLVSTSANDAAGGTGAQSLVVDGVDGTYARKTEVFALNGTTPVVTTGDDFLRTNIARLLTSGALEGNEGTITGSIGGNIQFQISPPTLGLPYGKGLSHDTHFTVPLGCTAYVEQVESWSGKDNEASIEMYLRLGPTAPWFSPGQIKIFRVPVTVEVFSTVVLPQTADFKFTAIADQQDVEISMFTTIMLARNSDNV